MEFYQYPLNPITSIEPLGLSSQSEVTNIHQLVLSKVRSNYLVCNHCRQKNCYAECAHLLPSPSGDIVKKEQAIEAKNISLSAVRDLTNILHITEKNIPQDEYEKLKEGVGRTIGEIQIRLLDLIYSQHPELNDLP